jgi:gamma-butyrobetaine dioxygenase
MKPPLNLKDIASLYAARGALNYGEGVTQLEHALQCAALAENDGAPPSLIAACLLHDIGHLFETEKDATRADDRHEASGALVLAGLFGEAVFKPVALHVAAKRYLCFKEAKYFSLLSPASRHSLKLQGGSFDPAQAMAFELKPYWQDAVLLRRLDDMGKRDEHSARAFEDFLPLLDGLLTRE